MGKLLLGALIGICAGWRFKHSHRAWRDWRRTLASIPGLRRGFYRSFWWSAVWVIAALLAVWAGLLHL